MIGEKTKEELENHISNLSSMLIRSYKELVLEGPLSAYFAVVEKGYMDAAQLLSPQVKESLAKFQDKIVEVVSESDYIPTANSVVDDLQEVICIISRLTPAGCNKKGPAPEAASTTPESGTSE